MIDVNKVVRTAIISTLSGNITVGGVIPIYDKVPGSAVAPWIRIGSQINTPNSAKACVNTNHTVTLEVVTRFTEPGGGKEQSDDITNAAKQLLFDGNNLLLDLSDANLMAWMGDIENDFTDEFQDETYYVVRRIVQFTIQVQEV